MERAMSIDEISREIIGAAIEVHRTLGGPGLLERVYVEALILELKRRCLQVQREVEVPVIYKGVNLSTGLRLDLLVQNQVIVEAKAVENYNKIFEAQALTYLRLTKLNLALVINFGERAVRDGIHRVVNNL